MRVDIEYLRNVQSVNLRRILVVPYVGKGQVDPTVGTMLEEGRIVERRVILLQGFIFLSTFSRPL